MMLKKLFFILVACVFVILLFYGLFTLDIRAKVSGSGKITAKWSAEIKDGFGSSTGYFFEINNTYYIGAAPFEYNKYNINETIYFTARYKNPEYNRMYMP